MQKSLRTFYESVLEKHRKEETAQRAHTEQKARQKLQKSLVITVSRPSK